MRELLADLRISARGLWKARGFTTVAVATLALGIALNATVLAVVNAYLGKSLPYPGAKRLYNMLYSRPGEQHLRGLETLDWASLADVIEHPISWDLDMFFLTGGEYPERAPGAWVTTGFMQGLGIQPALGRAFSPEEFHPGSPSVALISHSLWQKRFGGDAAVLGRRFQAYVSDRPQEAEAFTVIGVLPAGFWHLNRYTEILAPLRAPSYPYMARLREGAPPAVERRVTELVKQGGVSVPPGWQAQLRSTHGEYVTQVKPLLAAVGTAAGLVLVIACANVAFLLLLRATRREKEIAVRMALGAGRGAIARMLVAEALLLVAAATAAGVLLSRAAVDRLAPVVQQQLGRPAPGGAAAIQVDVTVLTAAAACCLLTAVLFALAPLAATWRSSLSRALHSAGRTGTEGRGRQRARAALVALELAGSVTLLAGCALMAQSVGNMLRVNFGFRTERLLTAGLGLRERSYPDAAARAGLYERMLARVAAIPGVESAALANWWTLQPPPAQPIEADSTRLQVSVVSVTPDYFATLGVTLAAGRTFSAADRSGSEPVAVISETLARRLWPDASAAGRRILAPNREMGAASTPQWRTVVGVVRDVRQSHADEDLADVYLPLLEAPGRFTNLYVRTAGPPRSWVAALRPAVKEVDPEVSLNEPRVFEALIAEQIARPRFLAWLLSGFAAFAAALALLGVYGVMAYAVKLREREIAVRMAVGADPGAVTRLFLKQGAQVVILGIAVGLWGAIRIGRLLESQLFGVRSWDPGTLGAVSFTLAAVGLAAVWWPSRRAARTDPVVALHEE